MVLESSRHEFRSPGVRRRVRGLGICTRACVGLYTVCTEYQRTVPRTARKKALFFPWKATNTLLAPCSRPRRFFESWWRVFRFLV